MGFLWALIKGAASAWLSRNGERYARAAVTVAAARAEAFARDRLRRAAEQRARALLARLKAEEKVKLDASYFAEGVRERIESLKARPKLTVMEASVLADLEAQLAAIEANL